EAMEQLRRAVSRVGAAMFRYEVGVLARMGPSNDPAYNLIANMISEYREKRVDLDRLEKLIGSVLSSAEQEAEALRKRGGLREIMDVLEAYDRHQKALGLILQAAKRGDPEALAAALREFQEACELLRARQIHAQVKIFTKG